MFVPFLDYISKLAKAWKTKKAKKVQINDFYCLGKAEMISGILI